MDAQWVRLLHDRLRAVVLLAGSVRSNTFDRHLDRSPLDLPIDDNTTLLAFWQQQVQQFARQIDRAQLQIRVMVSADGHAPSVTGPADAAPVAIESDTATLRGTAGLLRDATEQYHDDDYILVANGLQLLLEPLADLVAALCRRNADIAIVSHKDGTPSGMMLIRCAALRSVAPIGFVDLKEQALPQISEKHKVMVLDLDTPSGMPIRNVTDYLGALRRHHRRIAGQDNIHDAFAETWQRRFNIIEPGATVAPDARVHNSVVLHGAHVAGGANVVNSLVPGGQTVKRGDAVVDQMVGVKDDTARGN